VHVTVDERRHDRLAGQIDPPRASRRLNAAGLPDSGDRPLIDDEGRALDRRRAVAGDEACTFEQKRANRRLGAGDRIGNGNREGSSDKGHQPEQRNGSGHRKHGLEYT
jgi:hypothetical protein